MTATFDAYHKWLGIPPKDQPPNHYRLLSLELFESDPDVIDAGANRQMAYVHQHATGRHAALSQELLNAISAARMCLLDPKRKAAYDDELRAELNAGVEDRLADLESLEQNWSPPPATAVVHRRPSSRKHLSGFWKVIGFSSSVVVSLYLAAFFLSLFGHAIPEMLAFLPGLGGMKEPQKQPPLIPQADSPHPESVDLSAANPPKMAERRPEKRRPRTAVSTDQPSEPTKTTAIEVTSSLENVSKYWRKGGRSGDNRASFRYSPELQTIFVDSPWELGTIVYGQRWSSVEFDIQAMAVSSNNFCLAVNGEALQLGDLVVPGGDWQHVFISFNPQTSLLGAKIDESPAVEVAVVGPSASTFFSKFECRFSSLGGQNARFAIKNLRILRVPTDGETVAKATTSQDALKSSANGMKAPASTPGLGSPQGDITGSGEQSADDGSTLSEPSGDDLGTESADSSTTKLPVPDDDAQKKATAIIKDVYKADYDKAKSQAQKLELAQKLLQEGEQTEGDPTGKFVLLRTARDLAAQAGDVSVTIEAIDQIAANYDLDPLEMQAKAVTKLSKSATAVTAQRDLVDAIATIIGTAVNKDEYAVARQLAGLAVTVARKTKEPSLLKTAVARSKEIDEDAAAYKEAQESLKLLEEKPNDPDANLVVGKFKCFIKGDWQNGLPFLFRSNDATFKDLAEKELGDTSEPEVKIALGDGWWDRSEKETGSARDHLRLRAAYWYTQALPELRGLSKAKTEKRLAEIAPEGQPEIAGKATLAGSGATRNKKSVTDIKSPIAKLLKEKLHGKVAFDPKTNEVTIGYDWSSKDQLQDFEIVYLEPALEPGSLVLKGGAALRHKVDFSDVVVTVSVLVQRMQGKIVTTTGGGVAELNGLNADTIYLSDSKERKELIVPDRQRRNLQQARITFSPMYLGFEYGDGDSPSRIGMARSGFYPGRVALQGGEVGYQYGPLSLTGKVSSIDGVSLSTNTPQESTQHLSAPHNATKSRAVLQGKPRRLQLDSKHFSITGRFREADGAIEFLLGNLGQPISSATSKEIFSPPISATFEVTAWADGCHDIWPSLFGNIRLHWGDNFNKTTLIVIGDQRLEVPHVAIVPGQNNRVTMTVDKTRMFSVIVNERLVFSKLLEAGIPLNGPVILGGGIGHVTYSSVAVTHAVPTHASKTGETSQLSPKGKNEDNRDPIDAGLTWLVKQQKPDGSWRLDSGDNPSSLSAPTTGTALALLSILRCDHRTNKNKYGKALAAGTAFIESQMTFDEHGCHSTDNAGNGTMYGHAIVTMALCESLARTKDKNLRPIAQGAVDYIVFAQDPSGGGWRYQPRTPGDTSVVGWQVQALRSASNTHLKVPQQTIALADHFLDSTERERGARYAYMPSDGASDTLSAVGLFCRTFTRKKKPSAEFLSGLTNVVAKGPTPSSNNNIYYDYYGTQLVHAADGKHAMAWDEVMKQKLISLQDSTTSNGGSWFFNGAWSEQLGRVGVTCFCLMMLGETDRNISPVGAVSPKTGSGRKVSGSESSRLQGEWLCVAGEEIGQPKDAATVKRWNRRYTFEGDSLTMERTIDGKYGKYDGKFEIDPTTGHFDWAGNGPEGAHVEWVGIYELDGNNLKLCYRYQKVGNAVRPTTFTTDGNKPNISVFYTMKRIGK